MLLTKNGALKAVLLAVFDKFHDLQKIKLSFLATLVGNLIFRQIEVSQKRRFNKNWNKTVKFVVTPSYGRTIASVRFAVPSTTFEAKRSVKAKMNK